METSNPKDRPQKPHPKKTFAYLDLEFLLQEAPCILGEKSNHSSFESAVNGGGPGASVASSGGHDDHMDKLLGRLDEPNPIGKARRLLGIWRTLDKHSQGVLAAYYTPRVRWPAGFEKEIGPELASVALALPPDGDAQRLQETCAKVGQPTGKVTRANKSALLALKAGYRAYIQRARDEAYEHVRLAHEAWTDAVRAHEQDYKPLNLAVLARQSDFRARLSQASAGL